MLRDIGVVYLCRFAEGFRPVGRFIEAYKLYPAGVEHDLIVLFKGYPDSASVVRVSAMFGNIPFISIEVDDLDYDIGSYLKAANVVSNSRLIFMNTFSEILASGWLASFDHALSLSKVGLVGATGSWQANTAGYERKLKLMLRKVGFSPSVSDPGDARRNVTNRTSYGRLMLNRSLVRYFLAPFNYVYYFLEYGRYPNPHIRTNSFMIHRKRFLSLHFPSFRTKAGAYKFESGRRSMTKQIMAQGLKPVVVDRAGKIYNIADWRSSATFWTGDQVNLIIADNRTRDYAEANLAFRRALETSAWENPWN